MAQVEYKVDGRIAYITLNRPEKLNAIGHEMLRELWEAFPLQTGEEIKQIILHQEASDAL